MGQKHVPSYLKLEIQTPRTSGEFIAVLAKQDWVAKKPTMIDRFESPILQNRPALTTGCIESWGKQIKLPAPTD